MKKLFFLLAVTLPCLIFTACGDDDDDDSTPANGTTSDDKPQGGSQGSGQGVGENTGENTGETSVTGGVKTLYITGADIVAYLNVSEEVLVNTSFGVVYGTQSGVNVDNCQGKETSVSLENKEYRVTLHNLEAATQYYYRSYALIGSNYVYGSEKTFTTKGAAATAQLTSQEKKSATFRCTTNLETFDLQSTSLAYGLVYGASADVDIDNAAGRQSASGLENGGTYTISISGLKYSTTYYYRAYTRTGNKYTYSEAKSFTTGEGPAEEGVVNGHAWIDLGLPSGLKWATCNVGASSPEEYGDYFAWGETQPKSVYNWSTYKWCNGSLVSLTKYCTKPSYGYNGFLDNKTTLDPADDAAIANWGGAWRMPTYEEQTELCTKCTWTWTTQNGVYGRKVTGPNGRSIFLPVAGYRYRSGLYSAGSYGYSAGSYGYYWSSSLYSDYPNYVYCLDFDSDYVGWRQKSDRNNGHSVRPVCQ